MSIEYEIRNHGKAVKRWTTIMEEYGDAYRATGISAREWCEQRQVPVYSFYRWRSRLLNEAKLSADVHTSEHADPADEQKASLTFVDVTALATASDPAHSEASSSPSHHSSSGIPSIMIQVNDAQIYVNGGSDEATLTTVLKAVRNA